MNWAPPRWIMDGLHDSMTSDMMVNHYCHPRGRPRLINALKKHFSPRFENLVKEGRELKDTEIMASAGANGGESSRADVKSTPDSCQGLTEAEGIPERRSRRSNRVRVSQLGSPLTSLGTYAALVAHLNPGEEVILFEPFFDQYFASIKFQGANAVYVPLHPPAESSTTGVTSGADWSIDFTELRKAFNSKTKAIIVNTPHNPIGKVFTRDELTKIAELCVEFNVLCLADEVYDCMLYDDVEHVRMASLPGMWERTITIGSGGSECSLTRSEV